MRITACVMSRSIVMPGAWQFEIEVNGCKFTGMFDDFGGFVTMVTECAKFFAVRAGKLRAVDAKLTRPIVPGAMNGSVLPNDRPS